MAEDNAAEVYEMLRERDDFEGEDEAQSYAEAIGLDDFDVVNDR